MKILLVGATGILGCELFSQLKDLGHEVIPCGRSIVKLESLSKKYIVIDMFNSFDIINKSLDIISEKFDCIIFNQGIYQDKYLVNDDGLESHFMVNAFSQYILLKEILPHYDNLMVVTVSSISCYKRKVLLDLNSKNLKKWNLVYGNNKLLQLQLMKKLEKEYSNIDFRYAHPGISFSPISSGLHKGITNFFVKNFMMKKDKAVKPIIYSLSNNRCGYWSCPKGCFELVGKPRLKKIKSNILDLDDDVRRKIEFLYNEIVKKYCLEC